MRLEIVNWQRFQHYKRRNPPWIKLHRSLLDDPGFWQIDDFSARLLVCLWLLASEGEDDGVVHLDSKALAWRLRVASTKLARAIQVLDTAGFIKCDSALLASCYQDATPETETETEAEGETETEKKNLQGNRKRRSNRRKKRPDTWLTPYGQDWTEAYGGEPAWGELATYLRPLDEKHGLAHVRPRWCRYLAETEARFASPARFAKTFGAWDPAATEPAAMGFDDSDFFEGRAS